MLDRDNASEEDGYMHSAIRLLGTISAFALVGAGFLFVLGLLVLATKWLAWCLYFRP